MVIIFEEKDIKSGIAQNKLDNISVRYLKLLENADIAGIYRDETIYLYKNRLGDVNSDEQINLLKLYMKSVRKMKIENIMMDK